MNKYWVDVPKLNFHNFAGLRPDFSYFDHNKKYVQLNKRFHWINIQAFDWGIEY